MDETACGRRRYLIIFEMHNGAWNQKSSCRMYAHIVKPSRSFDCRLHAYRADMWAMFQCAVASAHDDGNAWWQGESISTLPWQRWNKWWRGVWWCDSMRWCSGILFSPLKTFSSKYAYFSHINKSMDTFLIVPLAIDDKSMTSWCYFVGFIRMRRLLKLKPS